METFLLLIIHLILRKQPVESDQTTHRFIGMQWMPSYRFILFSQSCNQNTTIKICIYTQHGKARGYIKERLV